MHCTIDYMIEKEKNQAHKKLKELVGQKSNTNAGYIIVIGYYIFQRDWEIQFLSIRGQRKYYK